MTAGPRIAAVVLAAGRSRRMGSPKALVDLRGEPALARVLRLLREAGVHQRIVVLNAADVAVRRAVDLAGVTTVLNHDPDSGMAHSIRIGVVNLAPAAEAFLLAPVDVPLFEADDVRALCEAWHGRAAATRIVAPSVAGRRGHPVLFDRALAAEFRALADDAPPHAIVRADPARVLHVERANPHLVRDLDTPDDVRAALGDG